MNGDNALMTTRDPGGVLGDWLKYLLYVKLVSVGNMLLGLLPVEPDVTPWIARVANAVCVYVLFQLSPACKRYRTVAVINGIVLIGSLFSLGSLAIVFTVCGMVGTYQEYAAHGEVVAPLDEKLTGKWRFLFYLEIILSLGGAVVSSIGVVAGTLSGIHGFDMYVVVGTLSTVIELLMRGIYLSYLNKTVKLFAA